MTTQRYGPRLAMAFLALTLAAIAARADDVLTELMTLNGAYKTAYRAYLTEKYKATPDEAAMQAHHRSFASDYARYQALLRANPALLVQIGLPMVAATVAPSPTPTPAPTATPFPTGTPIPTPTGTPGPPAGIETEPPGTEPAPTLPVPTGNPKPPAGIESIER